MKKLNVLDLFSGAGGLTEGFLQTGKYNFLAHIEWDLPMVNTLRANLVNRWKYSEKKALETVVHFDVQHTDELFYGKWTDKKYNHSNSPIVINNGLDGLIRSQKVDVIIGGPPCQAYSLAGRAQDPYSMKKDYRNFLFESFVAIVNHYKPSVFVFENVPGILSAKPGKQYVIERIYNAFKSIGYEIRTPQEMKKSLYSAADYSVPQERKRVIIIGVKKGSSLKLEEFYRQLDLLKSTNHKKTVRDAIGDLPKFKPLSKIQKKGNQHFSHELVGNKVIPLHVARYNNKRDINIFKKWLVNDMNKLSNDEKLKFYHTMTGHTTNHNKYRSIEWDKPSPTIVAHLYKDGLMFIHPDVNQLRTITIREAALLQSFPLDYIFCGSNAYCFKMIGNAVPVNFAKNIGLYIYKVLENEK